MRLNSLKSWLSTTSLAAFAALAGAAIVEKPAWAVDEIITTDSNVQRSLDNDGDDLTVTNDAQLAVSTGTAVIMNNNNTSLTVGLTTGTAPNGGPGKVTGVGQDAVQVNSFSGMNIQVNSNGTIEADAGHEGIRVLDGASVNITNAGTINQVNGGTSGQAIFYFDNATSTITNSGLIQASGTGNASGAIATDAGSIIGGAINNQAGGIIRATGQGASAINLGFQSSLTGGISNSGTIEATDATADDAGTAIRAFGTTINTLNITNNAGGLIQGTGKTGGAINVTASLAAVTIINNGTITNASSNTGSHAILINGPLANVVTIDNQNGLIENTGSAVETIQVAGGSNFAIKNGLGDGLGAIDGGSGRAIRIANGTGDITNNSVITNNAAASATIQTDTMKGSITNQFFGTIQNTASGGQAVLLNGTLGNFGMLDNAGIIRGGTGGNIEVLGTADDGQAITALAGSTNTIINRDTGAISGDVRIAQGVFNIEGGIINGDTAGESDSDVNFNLASVTLETTPGDGGFNPLTGAFGFETNGSYILDLGSTSSIDVNSGALFVHDSSVGYDMQAENFLIESGVVMRLDDGVVINGGTANLVNNGMLFVHGDADATINGPVQSTGAGNLLGFGIAHPTAGTAGYGLLAIEPSSGPNGDLVTDADTKIRIYNDFQGFTPAATGIAIIDTNDQITINGQTNVGGTLANMDTAFNDTLTLRYVAYVGGGASNDLLLDVIRTPLDSNSFDLTSNQRNAASALENIGQNGNASGGLNQVLGLLDSITEEDDLADALEQMLPIANGAALMGSVIAFDSVLQSIDSRLEALHMGGSNDMAMAAAAVADDGTRVTPTADVVTSAAPQSALWFRGGYGSGVQDTQDGPGGPVAGWDGDSWYGVVGADVGVSEDLRLGGTLAYVDSTFDGDDLNDSRLEIQSYQASLYGAWESNGWWATGVVGGGMNDYDGRRRIDISTPGGDFSDTKTSDYDGWQVTARAMVGTVIGDVMGPNVAPFVSLRYSHIKIDGYDEEGDDDDALSLDVDDQDYDQLLPGIGVRLAAPIIGDGHAVVPWLRASYQYDVIGDRQVTTSTFGGDLGSPQSSFVTEGARPGRDVLNLGGGLSLFSSEGLSAAVSVDWEDREDYQSWSGFGELRYAF